MRKCAVVYIDLTDFFSYQWRIKEDVPVNLLAVKLAAEKLPSPNEVLGDEEGGGPLKEKRIQRSNWGAGELLLCLLLSLSSLSVHTYLP